MKTSTRSSSNILDAADSALLSWINCAIPFVGSYLPSSPVSVPGRGSSLAGICCPDTGPACINKRAAIIAAKNFIFMIECKVRGSELYGGRDRGQRVHLGKPATRFGKPSFVHPNDQALESKKDFRLTAEDTEITELLPPNGWKFAGVDNINE